MIHSWADMSNVGNDSLLQSECRSFWKGYQFHDEEKEKQFHAWPDLVRFCQVCCVISLLIDLVPLRRLSGSSDLAFFLPHVPRIVIMGGLLILLSCFRSARRHILLCVGVAILSIAATSGLLVHFKWGTQMSDWMDSELVEVRKAISGNAVAMGELQPWLEFQATRMVLDMQVLIMFPQIALLAYGAGFGRSTLWALMLQPFFFSGALLMSPDVRRHLVLVLTRCCAAFLIAGIWILQLRADSLTRRRTFILQHHFQAALQNAVGACRKAEQVVSHTLLNHMADSAGAIELFLDQVQSEDPTYSELHSATVCLQRGMRACQHRQAYAQIVSDENELALQAVHLAEFVGKLVGPTRMQVQVPNCTLLLDTTLCSMVLDNAISNAFRHGSCRDSPVRLAVTTAPAGGDRLRLCFVLTNQVSPAKAPLTPDVVARAWKGTHRRQAPPGSPGSPMSDGIGLRQAFLASNLHNMDLDLKQDGTEVRFTARVIASVADDPGRFQSTDLGEFPPDLHVCVIDDSEQSRRMLEHHLLHRVTKNVHVFGESARDVEPFVEKTMAVADIAILDQNLEYGAEENVLGTDLIQRLLAQQFPGLVCVRSGNAAAEDAAFYRRCGAHCVFGKDVPLRRMIGELKAVYLAHARHNAAVQSLAEVGSSSSGHTRVHEVLSTPSANGHGADHAPLRDDHAPIPGVVQPSEPRADPWWGDGQMHGSLPPFAAGVTPTHTARMGYVATSW